MHKRIGGGDGRTRTATRCAGFGRRTFQPGLMCNVRSTTPPWPLSLVARPTHCGVPSWTGSAARAPKPLSSSWELRASSSTTSVWTARTSVTGAGSFSGRRTRTSTASDLATTYAPPRIASDERAVGCPLHPSAWRSTTQRIGRHAQGSAGASSRMSSTRWPEASRPCACPRVQHRGHAHGHSAAGTVRDIVDNPVYEGWQVGSGGKGQKRRQAYRDDKGHKISVAEEMDRMIPADVAERARRVPHGHQLPEGFRPGRTLHLLTGLVGCGGCRSAMSASGSPRRAPGTCTAGCARLRPA